MPRTLASPSQALHRAKDSRFIARAFPVESEEDVRGAVARVRKEHAGATHHCYAYRLGSADGERERSSDAGEPAGSAGAPILSAIRTARLSNVLIVVTRYFGGTKLGVGGLVRAYRAAGRAALEAAQIIERPLRRRLRILLPVSFAGPARSLVARHGGRLVSETYGRDVELQIIMSESEIEPLCRRLNDLTQGTVRYED